MRSLKLTLLFCCTAKLAIVITMNENIYKEDLTSDNTHISIYTDLSPKPISLSEISWFGSTIN